MVTAVEEISLPLAEGTMVLGRAPDSTVLLNDPMVSRHHAQITKNGSTAQIADMGSANGTRVNRVELPVKEWQPLRAGDLIEIGPFALRVKDDGSHAMATAILPQGTVFVPRNAPAPVLHLRLQDGSARDVTLTEDSYTLGRSPDNSIVVNDASVSRQHAVLEKRGASYEIIDQGSTNGLSINGQRIPARVLVNGDTLTIGTTVTLQFSSSATAPAPAPVDAAPAPIDLRRSQEFVLGRDVEGGGLAHPQVSLVHARILNVDGRLVIEDAGSAAGTFVNGNKVERQFLNEGDDIRLGGQSLRLVDGRLEVATADELTLEAVNLRRVVANNRTILQDVSFSIQSREFVAIVGPSGAGKSTLITALCGYQQADAGSVLINGTDFYSHIEAFRNDVGFVPQDDIIHRELSIRRAFNYAGRLRMPEDTRPFERDTRSQEVLQELDLTPHAQTPVRQLSGGQRKRVSIGVELLTQPSLLFLDEATSGLDPGTETQMMKLFRHLADNGRIVVLVTHATKNVKFCDKVAFMAKGGYLAFYGPPEEALTYFGTNDFDEIYVRLEERPGEEWANTFFAYSHQNGNAYRPSTRAPQNPAAQQMLDTAPSRSGLKQFITLTMRALEIMWGSKKDVAVLLALAPFLGLMNFILWIPKDMDPIKGDATDALNIFLVLTIVTLLVGSLGSVRDIVKEQAIYKRERMVCLQVLPYVFSKVFLGFLFAAYSSALLFLFLIASVDFSYLGGTGILELFVPVFLATFSGVMIGLLVSAIAANENSAMLLIIAVIIPQILLSGVAFPLHAGTAGQFITAPATSKWSISAMLTTAQVKHGACQAQDLNDCRVPGIGKLTTIPDKVSLLRSLDRYGHVFNVNIYLYWGAMLALIGIDLLGVVVLVKRKDAT